MNGRDEEAAIGMSTVVKVPSAGCFMMLGRLRSSAAAWILFAEEFHVVGAFAPWVSAHTINDRPIVRRASRRYGRPDRNDGHFARGGAGEFVWSAGSDELRVALRG